MMILNFLPTSGQQAARNFDRPGASRQVTQLELPTQRDRPDP
jgi:hypothetical protein